MSALSKTQQELLDAVKAGVVVHYMPYSGRFNPHPYFFRNDTMRRCTAAAEALIKKGLASRTTGWRDQVLKLKDNAS